MKETSCGNVSNLEYLPSNNFESGQGAPRVNHVLDSLASMISALTVAPKTGGCGSKMRYPHPREGFVVKKTQIQRIMWPWVRTYGRVNSRVPRDHSPFARPRGSCSARGAAGSAGQAIGPIDREFQKYVPQRKPKRHV